jgi:hypothetical protein
MTDAARLDALLDAYGDDYGTVPPAAPASLDTLATSSHWWNRATAERARARGVRNDDRKGRLADAIRAGLAGLDVEHDPIRYGRDGRMLPCSCARCFLGGAATRVESCRRVRAFRDAGCGAYLVRPDSCRVRLCPDCERARASRMVRRVAEIADAMAAPAFWTFTVRNVADLGPAVDVLLDAFATLRRRALFAGGPCRSPVHVCRTVPERRNGNPTGRLVRAAHPPHRAAAGTACRCPRCYRRPRGRAAGCAVCRHRAIPGGVYTLEVTRNAARRDWHPHLHVLMDAPWVEHVEAREQWARATCEAWRRRDAAGARVAACGHGCAVLVERRPGSWAPCGAYAPCAHRAGGAPADGCRGSYVVDVRRVTGARGSDERRAAVREVVKYATKGLVPDHADAAARAGADDPGAVVDALLALRHRRLVAGFGPLARVADALDDGDGLDPATHLVGPDWRGDPRYGLPRACPVCRMPAAWEPPIGANRRDVIPGPAPGIALWRPPRAGPGALVS